MKQILGLDVGSVTFTPGGAGAGTVVFSGLSGFNPARLLAITDITTGVMIYAAEVSGKGGTWSSVTMSGGTLTLEASTAGYLAGDSLRPLYLSDGEYDSANIDIEEICRLDGFPSSFSMRHTGAWTVARTLQYQLYSGSNGGGIGQGYFIKNIDFGSNRFCEGQLVITAYPQDGSSRGSSFDIRRMFNGGLSMPFNQLILNGSQFDMYTENGDGAPILFRIGMTAYVVTCDFNWNSRKTVLWIGDSIPAGSGVPNAFQLDPSTNYPGIVRDWLVTNGYDYRLINKSIGGSTTATAETWRKHGNLTLAFPKKTGLIFYNLGTNDSASPATALTNLQSTIPWLLTRHPGATIVVMGPTPAENNTTEAGLVTIRSNYSTYVSGLANPRVKFLDLGSAFDRTNSANYSTSDSAGNRIHPAPSQMPGLATIITNFLGTIRIP